MAPWLAEKSESICEFSCRVAEKVKALKISDDQKNELLNNLHPVLYDATKIVEYAYDTDIPAWDADAAQRMLETWCTGLQELHGQSERIFRHGNFQTLWIRMKTVAAGHEE